MEGKILLTFRDERVKNGLYKKRQILQMYYILMCILQKSVIYIYTVKQGKLYGCTKDLCAFCTKATILDIYTTKQGKLY